MVNRLVGWAGTLVTTIAVDDVAVSSLRRDRGRLAVHRLSRSSPRSRCATPTSPSCWCCASCCFRWRRGFATASAGGTSSPAIAGVGDPDLRHRGRRGVHRPRHHADPSRRRARRHLHRAAARGDAANHRLDRAVRGDGVHGLRLFRAVSAAAMDAPRLRRVAARRPSLHHARGHFRHSGRRVVLADHPVHDLRRVPAAFRRRQVLHRFLAWR